MSPDETGERARYAQRKGGIALFKNSALPCVCTAGCERSYGMEKPIDFWLRKGKAGGEPKPTETNAGKAYVRRYNTAHQGSLRHLIIFIK